MTALRQEYPLRWWAWADLLLIVLVGVLFFLPGLGATALFDRDEPRFAQAAYEMLDGGDYVVPHFNGNLRPDKPPLIYWLMTASYRVFGVTELGARLPSVIAGIGTLLVVYFAAGLRFGRITGLLAALMLASASLMTVMCRWSTADATMLFFNTLALACLWRAWDIGQRDLVRGFLPRVDNLTPEAGELIQKPHPVPSRLHWLWALVFWLALAGGTLTKGLPLGLVLLIIVVLCLATGNWDSAALAWGKLSWPERLLHLPQLLWAMLRHARVRWLGQLQPLWGLSLSLGLIAWWVVAAGTATDWVLIKQMIGKHVIQRATTGVDGHGKPPGFFLLTIWASFWPWSLILVPMGYHLVRRIAGRIAVPLDPRPYIFLAVWIIPIFIVFELSTGKLFHYILPIFPALAILAADTLTQSWRNWTDVLNAPWLRSLRWINLGIWSVLALAIPLGLWLGLKDPGLAYLSIPVAAALLATGVGATLAWGHAGWPLMTILGYGVTLMLAHTTLIPNLAGLQATKYAAQDLSLLRQRGSQIAAAGYQEPTLVFYCGRLEIIGTPTELLTRWQAATTAGQRFAVSITPDYLTKLRAEASNVYEVSRYPTMQLAKGKFLDLIVITNFDPLPPRPTTQSTTQSSTAPTTTAP